MFKTQNLSKQTTHTHTSLLLYLLTLSHIIHTQTLQSYQKPCAINHHAVVISQNMNNRDKNLPLLQFFPEYYNTYHQYFRVQADLSVTNG